MGVKFFFQNFEEKYPIIILRPKWANLGVKQSFGRFLKSDVAISKIGLEPPPLKDETDFSKLKCVNCKDAPGAGCGHSAFWFNCPAYKTAQKKLRGTIPYYDNTTTTGQHLNH